MKFFLLLLPIFAFAQAPKPLFDGRSFKGWEGDTLNTWRISNGVLIGGLLSKKVPENNFIATTKNYSNFDLRFRFQLKGTEGFVNSGVQFRSERASKPPNEMIGYQADLGEGYWGSLYDESRRNKTIAIIDSAKAASLVKKNEWNDYRVICNGSKIQIFLNGEQTVNYTEQDKTIPGSGKIAFQIHGGGKAEIWIKDVFIQEK